MRPIKFRVWVESILEEETGIYIPEYISWAKNGDAHSIDKVYTEEYKFKEDTCKFTLMQYTGLLDKNGKEIYEGDIATISEPNTDWEYDNFVVSYEAPQFRLLNGNKSQFGISGHWRGDECEVIGNVYENPDLLS